MTTRRGGDWTDIWMRWDWLVRHYTLQALLPGLTPGEIKDLRRRERKARQQRRYAFKKAVAEIRAKLAEWEAQGAKKPPQPVQLRLPL